MPDLTDTIQETAEGAAEFSTDGQTAKAHSLPDLIEADKYLKGTTNAGPNGSAGNLLRAARIIPPGAGPH